MRLPLKYVGRRGCVALMSTRVLTSDPVPARATVCQNAPLMSRKGNLKQLKRPLTSLFYLTGGIFTVVLLKERSRGDVFLTQLRTGRSVITT